MTLGITTAIDVRESKELYCAIDIAEDDTVIDGGEKRPIRCRPIGYT